MTTYLCGGINGLSDSECTNWRDRAKELLKGKTLDPMRRDYRGKEDQCVREIVWRDLWDILRSRRILVNATRPSWGTAMEIVYAWLLRKRIYAFTEGAKVSPWLRFHCRFVVETVEYACWLIDDGK